MEKHDITWYQNEFGKLKIDYQTRRGRADNEVLAFMFSHGPHRVTYMSVNQSGVTVVPERVAHGIFASWDGGGDRFEYIFDSLEWIELPKDTSPPEMKWDQYSAWEKLPPLKK